MTGVLCRQGDARPPNGIFGESPVSIKIALLPPAYDHDLLAQARHIYTARRMRDRCFADAHALFGEPGYDILLDLYIARGQRTSVSISSACIASSVAATTALRWIAKLGRIGLIERFSDPFDGRRIYLRLTARAVEEVERYLRRTIAAPT